MKFTLNKETEISTLFLEKILEKNKESLSRMETLENYYLGKHDILQRQMKDNTKPNNRIVNPFPQYITDTLSGYFLGESITYSSLDENALQELNMILTYNDAAAEDMSIEKDLSIYGKAYELFYVDENKNIRFSKINPKEIVIVYDDTINNSILYAIRLIPCYDILQDTKSYRIEVYSAESIKTYSANDELEKIQFISEQPHFFNSVPIVEYKNNEQGMGDFETIIPLIDAYDKLESDSLNDFEYFVDAYLALKGVTADSEDIKAMKENRVLLLDADSSAEWLIKNENDMTTENLKNRIKNDIHKFAKVPDLSDENFASNASGVAIKFKLYGTETLVSNKEREFKKGLQKRIYLIFNILNLQGSAFDWRAIDTVFTRNIPSNETEIAEIVNKLAGVVSTETLLAQIPFVTDIGYELEKLEKQKEESPFYNLDIETKVEDKEE